MIIDCTTVTPVKRKKKEKKLNVSAQKLNKNAILCWLLKFYLIAVEKRLVQCYLFQKCDIEIGLTTDKNNVIS